MIFVLSIILGYLSDWVIVINDFVTSLPIKLL